MIKYEKNVVQMANKSNGFGLLEKLDREVSYAMLFSMYETINIAEGQDNGI
jgi:hypothetical protein